MTSEMILNSDLLFWIGVAIIAITLLHGAVMLMSSIVSHRSAVRRKDLELALLGEQVEASRIHRVAESNRIDHVWSGFRKFQILKKRLKGVILHHFTSPLTMVSRYLGSSQGSI